MSRPRAKRCPRCGQVKPADRFYGRRGGQRLSPYCQPCTRATSRLARNRRRQDLAAAEQLRAADRIRQRRHQHLGGQDPTGGDAA
jgi:hypothetical protein